MNPGIIQPEVKDVGGRIKYLSYIFPCNMAHTDDPESIKLFGTGGQMLASIKKFMALITQLKTLKLVDLMLERYEANHLLDEVLESSCMSLKALHLVNVTMYHCPIMHVGLFLNLQVGHLPKNCFLANENRKVFVSFLKVLVVTPQNIDDDVLQLISDSSLKHLHLFQNSYSPPAEGVSACSPRAWFALKKSNPKLKVHLCIESNANDCDVVLQQDAPVYSVCYATPNSKVS